MKRNVPRLNLPVRAVAIAALVPVMALSPAAANTGTIGLMDRGTAFLWVSHQRGEFITLPDGIFDVSNRGGGYRIRFDSRRATAQAAQSFATTFCGYLGRSAAGPARDARRPRNNRLDFQCQ